MHGIAAHISRLDRGVLKTAPIANSSAEYFIFDFKSSEVGMLRTRGVQCSSVLTTMALSESISNVNISFALTSNTTFSSGFWYWL